MAAAMTGMQRSFAALRGDEVDRLPVSAWWHDFPREWSAEGLAETTLEAQRRYGWDYVKVNPRATYYGEAWGAAYAANNDRQPDLLQPGVSSPEDLRKIEPLDGVSGVFAEQLESLRLIAKELSDETPFIQTVFAPLACLSRTTGSAKYVQRLMREDSHEVMVALKAIAQTLAAYSRACLDAGASGIFFATVEWGSTEFISADDFDTFCRQFDVPVLNAVKDAPFNVLHVCRNNNHLAETLDYPVAAYHWDVHGTGNSSLAEMANHTARALMGGVGHETTIRTGMAEDVRSEALAAAAELNGRRFLLAPGCSVDPSTPDVNLRALVEAAQR